MSEALALSGRDLREMLSRQCEEAGGQSAWARKHDVAVSQVCEALNGKREVSAGIIRAMGYMPVTRYLQVRRAA